MHARNRKFIQALLERNLTLVMAESVTCGMAAKKLSTCKGVMDVLKASIVCYTEESKRQILSVPRKIIQECSCESAEVTEALVDGLAGLLEADIYAAVTGLASPGGSETASKPVGTVFFCFRYRNNLHHHRQVFRGTPLQIREKACDELFRLILQEVGKS